MYRALRRALFLVAPERIHTWVFALLAGRRPRSFRCAAGWRDGWRRTIRCWPARCSGCGSQARWAWPPDSTRTAGACARGARWALATRRSAPSPRRRSQAIRRRGCSGCPTTARCSTGWGSTTTARASWRCAWPGAHRRCRSGSTSARPRPRRQRPRSTTTPKARGWSARWPRFWWSTSAHRTRPGCVICRPSPRCGPSWPR